MNCEHIRKLLTSYLLGDLASATNEEIKSHLEECDGCRAAAREIEPTLDLLRDALAAPYPVEPPQRLSASRRAHIVAAFDAPTAKDTAKPTAAPWLFRHNRALAAAAGIMLVCGVFSVLLKDLFKMSAVVTELSTPKHQLIQTEFDEPPLPVPDLPVKEAEVKGQKPEPHGPALGAGERPSQSGSGATRLSDADRKSLAQIRENALKKLYKNPVPRDDPRHPLYQAQAHYWNGDYDKAWELYNSAPDKAVHMLKDLDYRFATWLIDRNTSGGRFDRAESLARRKINLLDTTTNSVAPEEKLETMLAYANIAKSKPEYPRAKAIYGQIAKSKEFDGLRGKTDAEIHIADIELATGQPDEATARLEKLLKQNDPYTQTKANYQLAKTYYESKDYAAANEALNKIFTQTPNHREAKILQGKLKLAMRRIEQATAINVGIKSNQETIEAGKPLRVTVEDPTLSVVARSTAIPIRARTASGDEETFVLRPFADSRTRFSSEIRTKLGAGEKEDGVLQVKPGEKVYYDFDPAFKKEHKITDTVSDSLLVTTDKDERSIPGKSRRWSIDEEIKNIQEGDELYQLLNGESEANLHASSGKDVSGFTHDWGAGAGPIVKKEKKLSKVSPGKRPTGKKDTDVDGAWGYGGYIAGVNADGAPVQGVTEIGARNKVEAEKTESRKKKRSLADIPVLGRLFTRKTAERRPWGGGAPEVAMAPVEQLEAPPVAPPAPGGGSYSYGGMRTPRDTDGDGLSDARERVPGTDPKHFDTDVDGWDNYAEHKPKARVRALRRVMKQSPKSKEAAAAHDELASMGLTIGGAVSAYETKPKAAHGAAAVPEKYRNSEVVKEMLEVADPQSIADIKDCGAALEDADGAVVANKRTEEQNVYYRYLPSMAERVTDGKDALEDDFEVVVTPRTENKVQATDSSFAFSAPDIDDSRITKEVEKETLVTYAADARAVNGTLGAMEEKAELIPTEAETKEAVAEAQRMYKNLAWEYPNSKWAKYARGRIVEPGIAGTDGGSGGGGIKMPPPPKKPVPKKIVPPAHIPPTTRRKPTEPQSNKPEEPPADFSPQPAQFDDVALVKSPVVMRGIYAHRSGGQPASSAERVADAKTDSSSELRERLKKIKIPEVDFRQANIQDVLAFLEDATAEYAPKDDPEAKAGVNIVPMLGAEQLQARKKRVDDDFELEAQGLGTDMSSPPLITMTARYISAEEALKIATQVAGLKYRIDGDKVVVSPKAAPDDDIIVRLYDVSPEVQNKLSNIAGAPRKPERELTNGNMSELFSGLGVLSPNNVDIRYDKKSETLIAQSTRDNVEAVEKILEGLAGKPIKSEAELARSPAWKAETSKELARRELVEKMKSIKIPEVDFCQAHIQDVLAFLQDASVEYDPERDLEKRTGVNIIPILNKGLNKKPKEIPLVTFTAREISLWETLQIVNQVTGLRSEPHENHITIVPKDAPDDTVVHREYKVPVEVMTKIAATPVLSDKKLRSIFSDMGVKLPTGSSIKYIPAIGKMVVANTVGNLSTFEAALNVLSQQAQDQAEAEAKEKARFKAFGVNPFYSAAGRPFSTFAIDVDTAAYTLARNYMQKGFLPPAESVRTEEFVNFFDYGYAPPKHGTFAVHADCAPSKFGRGLHMLKVGIKGRRLGREEQRPAVLTFLIDTSGSMNKPDRLGLAKKSLRMLVNKLGPRDMIAVVQYDADSRLVIEHTSTAKKAKILAAIDAMQCGGATNLEKGMNKAYRLAADAFVPGSENRVLLLSDGVANLGTGAAQDILASVQKYRKQGIFCSVFGFGIGTYDDEMLESLANKGNGTYTFIDSEVEAKRVFVDDLAATLNTIAADVKIQIQFNSKYVNRYRQLGYENRQLKKKDFRNDAVDAGEVGSGQSVTALYELDLKNSDRALRQGNDWIAMVRVRYRRTDTGEVEEIERPVRAPDICASFARTDVHFKLASAVAEFAEILRGSPFTRGSSYEHVARVLRPVALELDLDSRVQELARMVQGAGSMSRGE